MAPKLAMFLVSVTAIVVKHGFGLLSVTAETTTRLRREPKLSLLAIRYSSTAAVLLMSALSRSTIAEPELCDEVSIYSWGRWTSRRALINPLNVVHPFGAY